MMATHELGHVIGAYLTGGSGITVTLPLLGFSRTDVLSNPHPLIERWLGPTLGCIFPLLVLLIIRCTTSDKHKKLRTSFAYITGFCLIANGTYIGLGWIDRIGDTGDLLRHGASVWQFILFGLTTFSVGLYIWHRLIENLRHTSPTTMQHQEQTSR